MRGIYTPVTDIRRKVFTEVARMAYEVNELSDYEKLMRELPFKIIPGEENLCAAASSLERAIISERVRLAMGHVPARWMRACPPARVWSTASLQTSTTSRR